MHSGEYEKSLARLNAIRGSPGAGELSGPKKFTGDIEFEGLVKKSTGEEGSRMEEVRNADESPIIGGVVVDVWDKSLNNARFPFPFPLFGISSLKMETSGAFWSGRFWKVMAYAVGAQERKEIRQTKSF